MAQVAINGSFALRWSHNEIGWRKSLDEVGMHEEFMREAIRLSQEMMKDGKGGPFGAVIVKDGKIIARGHNQVTLCNDPTAHAEVVAIRNACEALGDYSLKGCEIYSSCEPCPMCLSAIYWSRVDKLYFGGSRYDAADAGLDDALLYNEIPLEPSQRQIPSQQLLQDEAVVAFKEWKELDSKVEY